MAFQGYLYLGFTNATALSPADVMPLAWWAKLAMTVQALGSLSVLAWWSPGPSTSSNENHPLRMRLAPPPADR